MTEAINSLSLICYSPPKQIPVHITTVSLYTVIFHSENKHKIKNRDCVSKCSVNFLIRFPYSNYSDELQGQRKSYPVTPTIYKNKDLGKHTWDTETESTPAHLRVNWREKRKKTSYIPNANI